MPTYRAPVRDWLFILHDLLRVEEHKQLPGFADLTPDLTSAVLEAAAQFHEDILHPLNQRGDAEGAHFDDGQVRTPAGFKTAWAAYREAGWHRLSLSQELGGAGLPPVMSAPVSEMRASTGHSFSMYSSFCAPAASMLAAHAPEWIRQHVVPRLSDGDWTATMCMTEPQAGTDLRQLSTRAVLQPDGTWRINGRKIFISGGEHDLTDNIIHIVLAKVPDAQGRILPDLSSVHVFMVSKRLIDPQTGEPGEPNNVYARSIEHKMGIEGSATCALDFDGALAWHIGETGGRGSAANMAPMFHLMNYARVGTALSGVGYAEIARQNAADYARERRSGRAGSRLRETEKAADPIIAHADVRRLLLEARSFTEGARAGAMRAAMWQTMAQSAPDEGEREIAADLLDILTPVMKAFFTDRGFDAAVACQQVFGGHGYIKDYGIEQFVRNARIGQLYEGANGIQASDLVNRRLFSHESRPWKNFVRTATEFIERHRDDARLGAYVVPLSRGLKRLNETIAWMEKARSTNESYVEAASYDCLTAIGVLYIGWTWAEIAAVVVDRSKCRYVDETVHASKLTLAKVWMQRQMPLLDSICLRMESGNDSLFSMPNDLI